MVKKVTIVLLMFVFALLVLLLADNYRVEVHTLTFDDLVALKRPIGILAAIFLPPVILSFCNNFFVNLITATYQSFILVAFLYLALIGVMFMDFHLVGVAVSGAIVSICSIIVTYLEGKKVESRVQGEGG